MRLKLAKTLWGVDDAPFVDRWDAMFARIRNEGFDAVEAIPLTFNMNPKMFRQCLDEHGLALIAQVHTSSAFDAEKGHYAYMTSRDVSVHKSSLSTLVDVAQGMGAVMVNVHGGCDCWETKDVHDYLQHAVQVAETKGITVSHETHRRRILYSPFAYRDCFLGDSEVARALDNVRVTADLSHWAVVCERVFGMPDSDAENGVDDWWPRVLADVSKRAALVHARVGFREGPQVPDPTAPEYRGEVDAHMTWWESVWRTRAGAGDDVAWVEPEFGPAPYLWALPHTRAPVADLWRVNADMAKMVKERFERTKLP